MPTQSMDSASLKCAIDARIALPFCDGSNLPTQVEGVGSLTDISRTTAQRTLFPSKVFSTHQTSFGIYSSNRHISSIGYPRRSQLNPTEVI